MAGELARIGHPMLATLLTVGLASLAQAEATAAGDDGTKDRSGADPRA